MPVPSSRSRSRTNSPRRSTTTHPLVHQPQPHEVANIRNYINMLRECRANRIIINFTGLIIAAMYNLPITFDHATTTRIQNVSWIRRSTYDRGPAIDITTNGVGFLRHHDRRFAQAMWLLAEAPQFSWRLRHYLRDGFVNMTNTMLEYLITYLALNPYSEHHTLDTYFVVSFMNYMMDFGRNLQLQNIAITSFLTAVQASMPHATNAETRDFLWLHSRQG